MTLVEAIWNGPFVGDRGPAQAPLHPGDVAEVSPEMLESGHWTAVNPVQATSPVKPATPATPAATPSSEGGS